MRFCESSHRTTHCDTLPAKGPLSIMTASTTSINDDHDKSDSDDLESIGNIKNVFVEIDHCRKVDDKNLNGNAEDVAVSTSALCNARDNDKGHLSCYETTQAIQDEAGNFTITPRDPTDKMKKIKSLAFNGASLRELQLTRMENQAAADREKLLQNRLRSAQLTASAGNTQSSLNPQLVSPLVPKREIRDDLQHTSTALPIVHDATKRELLKLNLRYAPTNMYKKSPSQAMQSNIMKRYHPTQQSVPDNQTNCCEVSPFNLILHRIGSENKSSQDTNLVTPEKAHMRGIKSDSGPEYLAQLTHLTQHSSETSGETNFDDGSSFYESSASSYTSPIPYDNNEKKQKNLFNDGADMHDFSCRKRMDSNSSQMKRMLQNKRLRKVIGAVKQALIIVGIVLFFAWIELAKDRVCSQTSSWINYMQDKIVLWLQRNKNLMLMVVSSRFQSAHYAITNWHRNRVELAGTLFSDWKSLVTEKAGCWHQNLLSLIQSQGSRFDQISSHKIEAAHELLRSMSLCEKHSLCTMCARLLKQCRDFVLTTKHISSCVWNRNSLLFNDWVDEIDFASLAFETLFRIKRLQLDCASMYQDAIQKLKHPKETAAAIWNSTVATLLDEWRDLANAGDPYSARSIDELVLQKSTLTNPVYLGVGASIVWHNETVELDSTVDEEVTRPKAIFNKQSFSLLRAHRYLHNAEEFRWNAQLALIGYGELAINDYEDLGEQFSHHVGRNLIERRTKDARKQDARKQYDSSFPTFLIDNADRREEDSFDSVNLMDMASQATKSLFPRGRRKRD